MLFPFRKSTRLNGRPRRRTTLLALSAVVTAIAIAGCHRSPAGTGGVLVPPGGVAVTAWSIDGTPPPADGGIQLAAAGNEWVSFTVAVSNLPAGVERDGLAVALAPPTGPSGPLKLAAADVEAFQLIDVPVDENRADAVRHGGKLSTATHMPRALLPLAGDGGGHFSVANLRPAVRSASAPAAAAAGAPASARIWFDVRVPKGSAAGRYASACQLLSRPAKGKSADWQPVGQVPVELVVHNFALPDQRALRLVGQVDWESLVRHYGDSFERSPPQLVSRANAAQFSSTVRTLDELAKLAQRNRVSVVYPQLQPIVKWPALVNNAQPEVRWDEFDALVSPWMTGSAFADGVAVGYWPLPSLTGLARYDASSRMAYWGQAASHFDQLDWLPRSAVALQGPAAARASGTEAIELSDEAAQILATHNRVGVALPLEEQQVQIAAPGQPKAGTVRTIDPNNARRLRVAAGGLIADKQAWQGDADQQPQRWLRADLPGVLPTAGAGGGEQDVRMWAWLAFLRGSEQVMFDKPLPARASAAEPADPSELTWFYPGQWFGSDVPVPSVQLKWLRQAEQDYEYLALAKEKGSWSTISALWMARVLTKPVEIGLGQSPDAAYALMTGTADAKAWVAARRLMAKVVSLAGVGETDSDRAARDAADIEILTWARPQEKPLLIARTAEWAWGKPEDGAQWVELSLGLDVYNAADVAPGNNLLRWAGDPPVGWKVRPQPTPVPPLVPYRVLRTGIGASFNAGKTATGSHPPLELELSVDSPTATFLSQMKVALPVSATEQAVGQFNFDGKLSDWTDADLIHDGPLVKMLSRPAVLAQAIEYAPTRSRLYTNWSERDFYVAFAFEGVKADAGGAAKNFVEYQARRAWGEDLCEVLVQPIYTDGTVGTALHVVCKPNGGSPWVERKLDPRMFADPWEPFAGTGTRYAAHVADGKWTGELAIPWGSLSDAKHGGLPSLLRFNVTQHRAATGESASWAGPVDFGRDDTLTGLLLRAKAPGGAGPAGGTLDR